MKLPESCRSPRRLSRRCPLAPIWRTHAVGPIPVVHGRPLLV